MPASGTPHPLEPTAARPVCGRCRHYHVTHDPVFPHGCRAFGVRSAGLPSVEVERTSGQPCLAFEPRRTPPSDPSRRADGGR